LPQPSSARTRALTPPTLQACRTLAKAEAAAEALRAAAAAAGAPLSGTLTPAECDLASLASVRAFAASFHAAGRPLHRLVLNAGLQYSGDNTGAPWRRRPRAGGGVTTRRACTHFMCVLARALSVRRTADGFEVTVGTNHLGHFLLANLLLPDVASAGPGARVVITASEVHDPASPGGAVGPGATLGDLSGMAQAGAAFEMIDGSPCVLPACMHTRFVFASQSRVRAFSSLLSLSSTALLSYDADKAYKDSKLCNLLFARELSRRLAAAGSPVDVVSFGPGLITRTGFFRNQNPLFTALFDFATNDLFHVAESARARRRMRVPIRAVQRQEHVRALTRVHFRSSLCAQVSGGGDCLVFMATDASLDGRSGVYYNNDLDGKGERPAAALAHVCVRADLFCICHLCARARARVL
jgi:protochlorophyllide reductase